MLNIKTSAKAFLAAALVAASLFGSTSPSLAWYPVDGGWECGSLNDDGSYDCDWVDHEIFG